MGVEHKRLMLEIAGIAICYDDIVWSNWKQLAVVTHGKQVVTAYEQNGFEY
jgi:hypothetical protein